jgi:hypothetical protein
MTQPIAYLTPHRPMAFPDQKSGLLAIGIVIVALGALIGFAGGSTAISLLVFRWRAGSSDVPVTPGIVIGLLAYLLIASAAIWCGIGCMRARRWVRPILLILCAWAVVYGCVSVISAPFSRSVTSKASSSVVSSNGVATSTITVTTVSPPEGIVLLISIAATVVCSIAIPGAAWWFIRRPVVKQTLEFYDPTPRWTDARPLPVIATALVCSTWALFQLAQATGSVAVGFGHVLFGVPALLVTLAISALLAGAGYLAWKQSAIGWWMMLAICLAQCASSILNALFLRVDELLTAGDLPIETAIELQEQTRGNSLAELIEMSLLMAAAIAYLLLHRRCLIGKDEPAADPPGSTPAPQA